MGDEIATLAGQIAAATARFLQLVGEFDAREGWRAYRGVQSASHWLSWRTGMDLRTAREQLRVARALRDLPSTSTAFSEGRLSYSKVRALTRVVTPETEEGMVDIATHAPAAHVERLTRGILTAARRSGGEAEQVLPADQQRHHHDPVHRANWRWDEDSGDLVFWGRFAAQDGAAILAALTRAEVERTRTTADHDTGRDGSHDGGHADSAEADRPADLTGPPPADPGPALVAMAQMCLTAVAAPPNAPAAEFVLLHGPADLVAGGAPEEPAGGSAEPPSNPTNGSAEPSLDTTAGSAEPSRSGRHSRSGPAPRLPNTTRVDGGPALAAQVAFEAMCAASVREVEAKPGVILKYGVRRRKVSPAQLKALHLRDRGCRMPGCGRTRFLHAHHVRFWAHGGPTDLDNLILLCGTCHRAVHQGKATIKALGQQRFRFEDHAGNRMTTAPPTAGTAERILSQPAPHPDDIAGRWHGEPLDASLATSWTLTNWMHDRRQRQTDGQRPV